MRAFWNLFLLSFIFFLSFVSYKYILPGYFSQQQSISLDSLNLSGEYDSYHEQGIWQGKPVYSYKIPEPSKKNVLGQVLGDKRIEIDLTNQRLYAYEGDSRIYDFPVSTGLWGRTPTGVFHIWTKIRYTKMEGGSQALGTYYYLPNVPFVMFFSSNEIPRWKGFSLHGTYWHNNFGHPMSHGCVNMRTEDVEKIYYWALPDLKDKQSMAASLDNPGTPIIIYGTAPAS